MNLQFIKCSVMSWFGEKIFAFHATVVIKMIIKWLSLMEKEPLKQCNSVSVQISLCCFIPLPTGRVFELIALGSALFFYHLSEITVFAVKAFSQIEHYASKLFKHSYSVIKFICKWFFFKKADTSSKVLKMNKGEEICTDYFQLLTSFLKIDL